MKNRRDIFDYIVVGSGSGGGVVAARLSEHSHISVLLVEAGSGASSLTQDMPAALFINFVRARFNWKYASTPQPELKSRLVFQPRGKALGGSSAINAMVYMRGHSRDFDGWANAGAVGWDYTSVLPYFKRSETYLDGGDPFYRGHTGPVRTQKSRIWAPVQEAFMAAGAEAGFPSTDDANGAIQEGFSMFDMNVGDGVRASTAQSFIRPAMTAGRLHVLAKALCARVRFEGKRAIGVEVIMHGRLRFIRAAREVILAAGAAKTPQLLMLSGIGPADHLSSHGITPVVDLPGVGENLQDHVELHLKWLTTRPVTYNRFVRPDRAALAVSRWLLRRDGICATNGFECGAVLRSSASEPYPDLLIHYYPMQLAGWRPEIGRHGFTLGLNLMRCASRGTVRLASIDPTAQPLIDPRYLSEQSDLQKLIRFVELGQELANQRAYNSIRGRALTVMPSTRSGREDWVRTHLESAYHIAGTCRMGSDSRSVADSRAKVQGVEGLRIADASLMPMVTNANLNAPTMMIGERIAEFALTE